PTSPLFPYTTLFRSIAWGVGSLLLLVGLGEGFRTGNEKQLAEIGENIIMMWPGVAPAVEGQHSSGKRYFLTQRDAADIATLAPQDRKSTRLNSSHLV